MVNSAFVFTKHKFFFSTISNIYLLLAAKNKQISIAKNVNIITYETNTRNISFIAGFDKTANKTVRKKQKQKMNVTIHIGMRAAEENQQIVEIHEKFITFETRKWDESCSYL